MGEDRAQKALMGKGKREDCPGETPKSKSPVLVLATQPNLLCDFEEVTELLCVAPSIRQIDAFLPFMGKARTLVKPAEAHIPALPLPSCVTLGKSVSLPELRSPLP